MGLKTITGPILGVVYGYSVSVSSLLKHSIWTRLLKTQDANKTDKTQEINNWQEVSETYKGTKPFSNTS